LTNWLVVEAGNPEQPMAQLFSSEVEAWAVADALNDRELKVRLSDVRQVLAPGAPGTPGGPSKSATELRAWRTQAWRF
jgi:hypothetical protein